MIFKIDFITNWEKWVNKNIFGTRYEKIEISGLCKFSNFKMTFNCFSWPPSQQFIY